MFFTVVNPTRWIEIRQSQCANLTFRTRWTELLKSGYNDDATLIGGSEKPLVAGVGLWSSYVIGSSISYLVILRPWVLVRTSLVSKPFLLALYPREIWSGWGGWGGGVSVWRYHAQVVSRPKRAKNVQKLGCVLVGLELATSRFEVAIPEELQLSDTG